MPCYAPDGRDVNEEIHNGTWQYEPCNPASAVSMCCATGPDRSEPDACVKDGLCFNSRLGGELWRESCTDPTWKSPSCVKLFVNGTGINETMGTQTVEDSGTVLSDVSLTDCGGGMYCHGFSNVNCCSQKEGVFVLNGEQVAFDPSLSPSTSAATSTPTNSNITATESSTAESSSDELSGGAKAGIGIGAALGALFVAGALGWVVWKRRKLRSAPPAYDDIKMVHDTHSQTASSPAPLIHEGHGQMANSPAPVIHEAPSASAKPPLVELPHNLRSENRYELA